MATPTHFDSSSANGKELPGFQPLVKHPLIVLSIIPSFPYIHHLHLSSKSMAPPPTTRLPSGNGPYEHIFAQKENTKRGLKRRASWEAVPVNSRALKQARRDKPHVLFLTRSPQKPQAVAWTFGNSQKFPEPDTPLTLFVWGCGDDGSFGLGPDYLEEIPRPQRLGGRWVTSIAAGGLYTLLLDRDGKVGTPYSVLHL